MLHDSSIRKSIDDYVKLRIRDIPSEIHQTFPNVKKIWKCENQVDFLYGYYVGKIEEGTLHYLLKATRASSSGFVDVFEIRGVIETYRTDLKNSIEKALT
ncbi:MAG: hypothetical protein K8Q89_03625 [Nitrosarchaeum sp.]|nr:hypothetical protein [Nitrosarchaeum sp.]